MVSQIQDQSSPTLRLRSGNRQNESSFRPKWRNLTSWITDFSTRSSLEMTGASDGMPESDVRVGITGSIAAILTLLLVFLISTLAMGQKNRIEPDGDDIIRKGLLRAQGTISPGWTISDGKTNLYLQGDMEYFASRRVSIKGDISYFLDTQGSGNLMHNHSLFFGAQYHFPIKRFDPYIGFHPGASLIQMRNPNSGTVENPVVQLQSKMKVSPAVSVTTGFNFYVWKYIHFLGKLTYVHAKHPTEWGTTYALNEFRIAFGLGWNVNMMRK